MLCISAGLHWYVYANLRRVLLRDYQKIGRTLAKIALWMFIILDLPFLFIYFRGLVHAELTMVSRVLLYPFVIWQVLMLMWVLILFPITIWRRLGMIVANVRSSLRHSRKQNAKGNEKEIALDIAAE